MPWSPGFWVGIGWRAVLAGASLVPSLERRLYPDHQLAKDILIEPGGDDRYPSLALVEQWGAPHLRLRLRLGNRSPYDRALIIVHLRRGPRDVRPARPRRLLRGPGVRRLHGGPRARRPSRASRPVRDRVQRPRRALLLDPALGLTPRRTRFV